MKWRSTQAGMELLPLIDVSVKCHSQKSHLKVQRFSWGNKIKSSSANLLITDQFITVNYFNDSQ